MKILKSAFILTLLIVASQASATSSLVICENKKTGALVVKARCNSGEVRMNAESLTGAPGTPALSAATCQKRHFNPFTATEVGCNSVTLSVSAQCNTGEYLHNVNEVITNSYSNDYSVTFNPPGIPGTPDSSKAGTSTSFTGNFPGNVLDNSGLFIVGYAFSSDSGGCPGSQTITGSHTYSYDVTLTCCQLG